MVHSEVTVM